MTTKITKGIFIITMFVGVYTTTYSQWVDNFSDNEFISNPEWTGNINNFIVEGEILRLNAPAVANSSYLSTLSNISLEAEWDFTVRLDFNPSSSNYAKVYLLADTEDLNLVANGYFVKIGGTPDEISLYKVVQGAESIIIDGMDGRVSLSSVEVDIRVTRNTNHLWELKTKLVGEPTFVSEGTVINADVEESTFFGFYCKYTATRSTKFYFDNVMVVGSPYVDSTPPSLVATYTPSLNKILLGFNEALDTLAAKNILLYRLNSSEIPTSVIAVDTDSIQLTFANELSLFNTLELTAIPDLVGNNLDTLLQVVYVNPAPYAHRDVVINEIFPDPSPQEDLPTFEFIEIYNISDRVIDLEGWQLTDGSKVSTLKKRLVYPDSLLILCPIGAQVEYELFGHTMALYTWPTLNNSGDALVLTDNNGTVIDSLTYSASWYNNTEKDDGGWTLEQINPFSTCLGNINWGASIDPNGGTPGKINSLYSENTDTAPPQITQALLTGQLIEIWLSELAPSGSYEGSISMPNYSVGFDLEKPSNYLIGTVIEEINLNTYRIEIPLKDCNGNLGLSNSVLINIAAPKSKDIIINEILFNPFAGGSDFVELYNNSEQYFNLKNYQLFNDTNNSIITDTTLLLKPQHYLALSEDIVFLKNEYLAPDSSLFNSNLPSLPNDEGLIVLKSASGTSIDSVNYNEKQHFSLINDVEGISLERISFSESSSSTDNWRSAAESSRFATPGYKNSQSLTSTIQGKVTVSPEIITPNNDGQSDFCQISFSLESQSQSMSIAIYNLQGQLVKTVANNAIIPPSGFFTWDGTNQQGGVLPTAHYIIVSEIVVNNGHVFAFRNKVVVANGF